MLNASFKSHLLSLNRRTGSGVRILIAPFAASRTLCLHLDEKKKKMTLRMRAIDANAPTPASPGHFSTDVTLT